MTLVTPEVFQGIADKIESPDYPDITEWDPNPSEIYLSDSGDVIFKAVSVEDGHRILYAMMRVISGQ